MSLSASGIGTPISAALVVAGAVPGAATSALGAAIGAAVVAEITVNAIVLSFGLVAAGSSVTGAAVITGLDADRFKTPLRVALIAAGAADIPKTTTFATSIASAIVDEIETFGSVPGTGFAAPPLGGPVTGASTVSGLNAVRLGVPVKDALVASGAADGAATAALALAIAGAVCAEVLANAVVPFGLLIAPPGGGPITGATVIT
jgi:hypothetical protein